MADSGIRHVVSTIPVPQSEFEDEEFHALIHGTSFPASPVERQLYYRDDTHKWYIYNGTAWKETTQVYTLEAHAASHQNGGGDEISVAGLSGELVDNQPPKAHKASHEDIGADEISIEGLAGSPAQKAAASGLASLDASSRVVQSAKTLKDADGDTSWDVEESADKDEIQGKVKGVEFFRGHDDGIITLAKQSGFHAYQNVGNDQTIDDLTDTVVNMTHESYDIQAEYDLANDKFTAKKAGTYLFYGRLQMKDLDDGEYIAMRFVLNAAVFANLNIFASANVQDIAVHGSIVIPLAAADEVEFKARHNHAPNRDTYSEQMRVYWGGAKIA